MDDFCYKIILPDSSEKDLVSQLDYIYNRPMEEIREKSNNARAYFDTVIRDYFADPTKEFIEWLNCIYNIDA